MSDKKTLTAVALAYDLEKDRSPRVTASGHGHIAEKILEIARQNGIPIKEDPALAEILAQIDPGGEIPPETFRAVAEILVFVYKLDKEKEKQIKKKRF